MFPPTKTVQFTPDYELVEAVPGKKRKRKRSSLVKLLPRSRKDSTDGEAEEPQQLRFLELLALNLPDWYLVLLGVICASLLGALFPVMAVVFSGFLKVGVDSSFVVILLRNISAQVKR